jgi:hypothetical protein
LTKIQSNFSDAPTWSLKVFFRSFILCESTTLEAYPDKKLIPCVRATILQQLHRDPRTVERAMDRSLEAVEIVGYARGWSIQDLIYISVLPTVLSNIGHSCSN